MVLHVAKKYYPLNGNNAFEKYVEAVKNEGQRAFFLLYSRILIETALFTKFVLLLFGEIFINTRTECTKCLQTVGIFEKKQALFSPRYEALEIAQISLGVYEDACIFKVLFIKEQIFHFHVYYAS